MAVTTGGENAVITVAVDVGWGDEPGESLEELGARNMLTRGGEPPGECSDPQGRVAAPWNYVSVRIRTPA